MQALPIDPDCPHIARTLAAAGRLVLTAAPGAGKSTRVPPALLTALSGRIMVLQPRRVAARALARRVAAERGERVGATVGFQTRIERCGGPETRLWFITEGLLQRRLHEDPFLEEVGAIVFDEFHERSVAGDLLLGWGRDLQADLRPDLHLLVMSATMDAAPVAAFLADAPQIAVAGAAYPITTRNQPPRPREGLPAQVLRACAELDPTAGDVLVFLPGVGEIRACAALLSGRVPYRICTLHAGQPASEQDLVFQPDGAPRLILATNIAETSLTVPGVRCVIDAGLQRVGRYDPARGLDELRREPCSRFAAEQRRGRAGRLGPGLCIRLYARFDAERRPAALEPAILRSDPLPWLLDLAAWYGRDPGHFPWLTPPDPALVAQGQDSLHDLGLLDASGALSPLGARLVRLPLHPRLSCLLQAGASCGRLQAAAGIAALLSAGDIIRRDAGPLGDDDLPARLAALDGHGQGSALDRRALTEARRVRDELLQQWGTPQAADGGRATLAELLLRAWPDRLAVRTGPGSNRVRLATGVVLTIDAASGCHLPPGSRETGLVLVVAATRLRGKQVRSILSLGHPIDEDDLQRIHPELWQDASVLVYDRARDQVQTRREQRFGHLRLRVFDGAPASGPARAACLQSALADQAPAIMAQALGPFAARYRWLAAQDLLPLPSWEELAHSLWPLACQMADSRAALLAAPWRNLLRGLLAWPLQQRLEDWAPSHYPLPSGRSPAIDYAAEHGPVLAARIQDFFGLDRHPCLIEGRVPLCVHLLAPNQRVQQITQDLPGFWRGSYALVRKELRGRYPKHDWPEDPLTA